MYIFKNIFTKMNLSLNSIFNKFLRVLSYDFYESILQLQTGNHLGAFLLISPQLMFCIISVLSYFYLF